MCHYVKLTYIQNLSDAKIYYLKKYLENTNTELGQFRSPIKLSPRVGLYQIYRYEMENIN